MNTREKLSWTLLGVALFFGIAAVSTDTTFFQNISSSGWLSLSGETNRLTVAGDALLLDGSAIGGGGGGESLWTTNSDGWITPAGGAYLTNTLVFTSGLEDDPTNAVAVVNSSDPWTDGYYVEVRNSGTNVAQINAEGGFLSGRSAEGYVGSSVFPGFYTVINTDHDELIQTYIQASLHNDDFSVEMGATLGVHQSSGPTLTLLGLAAETLTSMSPYAPVSSPAYRFGTAQTHTSGNLLEVKNNTTNQVAVSFDGRIILAGTTNQVVFGSTNTAPGTPGTISKWISVQVQGESVAYRIPLYE